MKFTSTVPSNKLVNISSFVYLFEQHVGRPIDYMEKQTHINPKMRAILVDWITDVHFRYNLLPETLYLTIYIIDRYLSLDGVKRLQLVGMCALLIACKYEELRAPRVYNTICPFFPILKIIAG